MTQVKCLNTCNYFHLSTDLCHHHTLLCSIIGDDFTDKAQGLLEIDFAWKLLQISHLRVIPT